MSTVEKVLIPAELPKFSAELRGEGYYGLDKGNIKSLLEEKLRGIQNFDHVKNLPTKDGNKIFFMDGSRMCTYSERLTNAGLGDLYDYLKNNHTYRDQGYGSGNGTKIGIENIFKGERILFDIDAIYLQSDNIIIKSKPQNGNSGLWKGKISSFLEHGLSALIEYYKGELPETCVYTSTSTSNMKVFGNYKLQYTSGENLSIEHEKKIQPVTIPAKGGYDFFPKEKGVVDVDVVVTLKPRYVDFRKLNSNERHIYTENYFHYGLQRIDYAKYGTLVQGKLDPHKNFVVGIFENNGQKSLKIIRLQENAPLMYEFPDIEELVGFDGADIVCYDEAGKLRNIDCNFESLPLYYAGEISCLAEEEEGGLHTVPGGCISREQVFLNQKFSKILGSVLNWSHPLVNKNDLVQLLERIRTNDLITEQEKNTLLLLIDPAVSYNTGTIAQGDTFLDKIELISTKPKDALLKLLSDSSASDIFGEYMKKVEAYEHVADVEHIKSFGKELRLIEKDGKKGVYRKQEEMFVELIVVEYDTIDIRASGAGIRTIEAVQGTQKKMLTYKDKLGVTDEINSDDAYSEPPKFDTKGCGIAKLKSGGMIFVKKNGQIIEPYDGGPYDNIELIAGAYLIEQNKKLSLAVTDSNGSLQFTENFFNSIDKKSLHIHANGTAILVRGEDGKSIGIVSRGSDVFLTEHVFPGSSMPSKVNESNISKNTAETFASTGRVFLLNEKNEYFTVSLQEGGVAVLGEPYFSLWYGDREKGFVGPLDGEGKCVRMEKVQNNKQETIFEGETLGRTTNPLMVYFIRDDILTIVEANNDGVHQASMEKMASWYKVTKTTVKKVDVGGKKMRVLFTFSGDDLVEAQVTEFDNVGNEETYGAAVYQWYKQGKSYGLLMKKDDKFEIYKIAVTEEEPVFGKEGISFAGEQLVINDEGLLEKLTHDFDEIEAIPGTTYFLVCKDKKWGYATREGTSVVAVDKLTISEKPKIYEGKYLITKKDDCYELYDIRTSGIPGVKIQRYNFEPEYHGYDIFTLPVEAGFYLVRATQNFVPDPTKYVGNFKISSSNGHDYIRLDTTFGYHRLLPNMNISKEGLPQVVVGDKDSCCDSIAVYDAIISGSHCFVVGIENDLYGIYYVSGGMLKRLNKQGWRYKPTVVNEKDGKILICCKDGTDDEDDICFIDFNGNSPICAYITKGGLKRKNYDTTEMNAGIIKKKGMLGRRNEPEWEYVTVI